MFDQNNLNITRRIRLENHRTGSFVNNKLLVIAFLFHFPFSVYCKYNRVKSRYEEIEKNQTTSNDSNLKTTTTQMNPNIERLTSTTTVQDS